MFDLGQDAALHRADSDGDVADTIDDTGYHSLTLCRGRKREREEADKGTFERPRGAR
jgi:hypothetical protein